MGLIVYSSPYVPAEMIMAYGLTPSRIIPLSSTLHGPIDVTAGVCPYMRGFVNTACAVSGVSAIILSTVCDQMRRAKDYIEQRTAIPSFLLNVPSTWQTPEMMRLYISELDRFGQFLEGLGGRPPAADALWQVMEEYDRKRQHLRGLNRNVPVLDYSMAIVELGRNGESDEKIIKEAKDGARVRLPSRSANDFNLREGESARALPGATDEPSLSTTAGIPVALLGGPLAQRDFALFDLIERSGGNVVLDGTETGERTMPKPFNRRRSGRDDPFEELARCYFGHIPDVFQRPNSELYRWLRREIDSRGVVGVILIRHTWCDKWHAEAVRMKEWLEIPLLDIDIDGESSTIRNSCRIEAFIEALS